MPGLQRRNDTRDPGFSGCLFPVSADCLWSRRDTRPCDLHRSPSTERSGVLKWSDGPKTHFHVIIRNTTAKPKRIFEEWNSWGYRALSFELTDEHGVTKVARKGAKAWTMNGATSFTIPPHESTIIDVFFADRTIWGESFWLTPGHPTGRVTLKAIYEVRPDKFSKKYGVWTGKITSAPVECLFK